MAKETTPTQETNSGLPKKVLLVDDDADFLFVLAKTIESWGYEVITAGSGREAIASAAANKPDIIIMDYKMPEMDGITALREICKTNTKVLTILFTGDLDSVPIKGIEELGIATFLPKSHSDSMLKMTIEMAVKKLDEK